MAGHPFPFPFPTGPAKRPAHFTPSGAGASMSVIPAGAVSPLHIPPGSITPDPHTDAIYERIAEAVREAEASDERGRAVAERVLREMGYPMGYPR